MPEHRAVIRDLSKGKAIEALLAAFESAKHIDEDGVEFWLAETIALRDISACRFSEPR